MRFAIISDIHEDISNLEKAITLINKLGYDVLVCLGDITGYAPVFHDHTPDANGCIDLLKSLSAISVAGNHDFFSVKRLPSYHEKIKMSANWYQLGPAEQKKETSDKVWLYQDEILPKLSNENSEYLLGLEEYKIFETNIGNLLFSHFVEPDIAGATKWFPYKSKEFKDHFNFLNNENCNLAFTAHCHPEGISVFGKVLWSTSGFEQFQLKNRKKIIFCPPVVSGKSTPGFVIFDTGSRIVKPYRIEK